MCSKDYLTQILDKLIDEDPLEKVKLEHLLKATALNLHVIVMTPEMYYVWYCYAISVLENNYNNVVDKNGLVLLLLVLSTSCFLHILIITHINADVTHFARVGIFI